MKNNIIIATIKSWNVKNAKQFAHDVSEYCNVTIVSEKDQLSSKLLQSLNPRYIFFPHWSWIIPPEIFNNYECIVFHMTDLPFGRGGSPLQNLLVRKVYQTKISAIKVQGGVDTGPIYFKKPFDISQGSANEIFTRLSDMIFHEMIPKFLQHKLVPVEQQGEIISFKRRKPEQSNMLNHEINTLSDAYDFIRMLDGEGYPTAYIEIGDHKLLLQGVKKQDGKLVGTFEITQSR